MYVFIAPEFHPFMVPVLPKSCKAIDEFDTCKIVMLLATIFVAIRLLLPLSLALKASTAADFMAKWHPICCYFSCMQAIKRLISRIRPKKVPFEPIGRALFIGLFGGLVGISAAHTLTCKETHRFWSWVTSQPSSEKAPITEQLPPLLLPESDQQEVSKLLDPNNFSITPLDRGAVEKLASQIQNQEGVDPKSFLSDPENKISKSFKMPKALRKRTGFWLDVYTKYGQDQHVIHHVNFPWIVFDVVDTAPVNLENSHRWTKYHKKRRMVNNRRNQIKDTLRKLAKRKSYRNLKGLEKQLFNAVSSLKGRRQDVFRSAYLNLRTQKGQRDYFLQALVNSSQYIPFIEFQFIEKGLPKELSRLPFVESSFNEAAQSKVGASGIWQIMPASARDGLIRNKNIDERNSPFKATLYAIKHLKRDYRILKDWGMAVTAYNHGIGNLKKAKQLTRARSIVDIINRNQSDAFGFASKNFFTSFLAVIHAEAYHRQIFKNIKQLPPLRVASAKLKQKTPARELTKILNLIPQDVYVFNLDIRNALEKNLTLPKGFRVYFPASRVNSVDANQFSRPRFYGLRNQNKTDWQTRESRNI
ncbi:MAG: lytic transglycosylase domain-containing protein [Bdellovibrionales bacterium]